MSGCCPPVVLFLSSCCPLDALANPVSFSCLSCPLAALANPRALLSPPCPGLVPLLGHAAMFSCGYECNSDAVQIGILGLFLNICYFFLNCDPGIRHCCFQAFSIFLYTCCSQTTGGRSCRRSHQHLECSNINADTVWVYAGIYAGIIRFSGSQVLYFQKELQLGFWMRFFVWSSKCQERSGAFELCRILRSEHLPE